MLSPANLLILDEPTNHLDIPSKEILESALRDYTGTVFYVSHDRYFINKTATRILELREKVLTNYKGNYDYYEEKRDELFRVQHSELSDASGVSTASSSESFGKSEARLEYEAKKASYAEERKRANALKRVETAIEKTETEIAEMEETMNDPANGTNVSLLLETSKKKEEAEAKLEELYTEWEELQS